MPKICYTPKKFGATSLAIIDHANEIIADYARQGFALTLRQLYYRFVAADLIANTQASYKRLGSIINDARLAGMVDWLAIEDRGRNLEKDPHWTDPPDIVASIATQFNVDKWVGQEYRVEVWVEKQALEAVIGRAAQAWDCSYFSCKGYTSQSEMWRAAIRFIDYMENGQKPVIIHLGDHDPSGIDMTRDIVDRLNDVFWADVIVDRIALNMDQIEKYDPPPNPAKMVDPRFETYAAQFGDESWELDALEPKTLDVLIQDRIEHYCDVDRWEERMELQNEGRRLLQQVSDNWEEVAEGLIE